MSGPGKAGDVVVRESLLTVPNVDRFSPQNERNPVAGLVLVGEGGKFCNQLNSGLLYKLRSFLRGNGPSFRTNDGWNEFCPAWLVWLAQI